MEGKAKEYKTWAINKKDTDDIKGAKLIMRYMNKVYNTTPIRCVGLPEIHLHLKQQGISQRQRKKAIGLLMSTDSITVTQDKRVYSIDHLSMMPKAERQ